MSEVEPPHRARWSLAEAAKPGDPLLQLSPPLVALFITSLSGGGAERSTVRLANALCHRGYTVDLVLAKASGPLVNEVTTGVRVIDLHAPRLILSVPALARYLRNAAPTALISAMDQCNLVAIWAKRLSRMPTRLIVSVRSTLSQRNGSLKRWIVSRLIGPAYRRHADAVVAVSAGVADDLAAFSGLARDRIEVIYNPVVSEDLFRKASEPLEHPWLAAGQPPLVVAAGRLSQEKNFQALIRAFAMVREKRCAHLLILGEGPERGHLETLIGRLGVAREIALPGFVANPFPYIKRANLFVLSSLYEGLPGALIEAAALGTPLVSTDCPSGPREILEDGKWGQLVPVDSIDKLADAILHTLDNPGPDPSPRGAQFSADRSVDRYLDVIGRALLNVRESRQ